MTTHTSKDFATELRTLRERLAGMGGRCEPQISLAMKALSDLDDELAKKVIKGDEVIDRDETEIDELALQILATRQPVASDLRFITMSLKFVTDLERKPEAMTVITAIIALADGLALSAVAEGVETLEQRDRLLQIGCRLGQGYLLGRPLPEHEALELLRDRTRR